MSQVESICQSETQLQGSAANFIRGERPEQLWIHVHKHALLQVECLLPFVLLTLQMHLYDLHSTQLPG